MKAQFLALVSLCVAMSTSISPANADPVLEAYRAKRSELNQQIAEQTQAVDRCERTFALKKAAVAAFLGAGLAWGTATFISTYGPHISLPTKDILINYGTHMTAAALLSTTVPLSPFDKSHHDKLKTTMTAKQDIDAYIDTIEELYEPRNALSHVEMLQRFLTSLKQVDNSVADLAQLPWLVSKIQEYHTGLQHKIDIDLPPFPMNDLLRFLAKQYRRGD